ncbi:cytochrome c1 [Aureimonas ureilytica]|uniref:cytochrome c1 n=1 Tax=Aureimonas ureilytica TaxID=401562 RepID=UPI003CEEE677
MKKRLSALVAACLISVAAPAFAQAPTPPAEAPEASQPPGAAPESGKGAEAAHAGAGGAAEHATPHYPLQKPQLLNWSFAGPFGHWDLGQLQRGLKVYKEVCSACHSMNLVAFRNFTALGYSDAQVRALAAEYQITDPAPNAQGEMFQRPGIPADHLPAPFPNPEAAAAALGGAHPPDLSLIAKARAVERGFPTFIFDIFTQYAEGGPDYVHSLLTGYGQTPPEGMVINAGTYYNPHFISGPALAMAPPLSDGQVTYDDGAPQTVDQYARDVSAFLMWAAEPHLVERKATGFVVMIFLIGFAIMLGLVKKRVWASTPH